MNETASSSLDDVDAVIAVLDANGAIGPGDRLVLERATRQVGLAARAAVAESAAAAGSPVGVPTLFVVVNKIDRVGRDVVLSRLAAASELVESFEPAGEVEYLPVSATTGKGVDGLVEAVLACMPEGPRYYPEGMVTDVAEAFWVADLVREELLHRVDDELPHSIACRVTEWEWPRIRCEILVERDSQKGIVIGKGGAVLKQVGTAVRSQLPPGAYLELFVRVEKRWQQREDALDRLGL
jgi:GTP-binding protein Era